MPQDRHRHDLVAVAQPDAAHPEGIAAAEQPDVRHLEADRLAEPGRQQDVVALVHGITAISWSPSSSFIARLPARLMLVKSLRALRRIVPAAVANMTCRPSQLASSAGIGMTVWIHSPSSRGSRLTIGRPRDCGVPSGSR